MNILYVDKFSDVDLTEIESNTFIVVKTDTVGVFFLKPDKTTDYISRYLFEYIIGFEKNNKSDKSYVDKLVMLSGKYTAEDIIKFKNEGMI